MGLEFFVPSNRRTRKGEPAHLDGLNELVRGDRTGRGFANSLKRANADSVEAACREAMREQGWKTPRCKCIVTLTFVETDRSRDPDNIFGGAKFILDGISKPKARKRYGAGAIVDDSQKWIELHLNPEIRADKSNPGCWVKIEEMEM